jgi:hypothetical protein
MTRLILLFCLLVPGASAQFFGGNPIGGSNGPVSGFPGPQSYRDTATGITFYVESDGLHIAAISKEGKILWVRDPFHDAKMSDYRTHDPKIVSIGKGSWFINGVHQRHIAAVQITFNSSQFGTVRMSDGAFQLQGQD